MPSLSSLKLMSNTHLTMNWNGRKLAASITCKKFSDDLFLRLKDVIVEGPFEHLEMDPQFAEEFPDTITLAQTVAVWKHIVDYQDRLKQE